MVETLKDTIKSAGEKLRRGMNGGPDSDHVVLTPAEATVIYRLLTEVMKMSFGESK